MDRQRDKKLREQLVAHIHGGEAFTPVDAIMDKVTAEKAGVVPGKLPYSFYQQFYHLRFTQYDILEFTRNSGYISPPWPKGYWPEQPAPENKKKWREIKEAYVKERREFCEILNSTHDLFQPIPHGNGQTLLREALLVIEHTAYHTGQLHIILRLLGKT
ncbi:MAG: DinB family protein [Balneolales bacterium]